MLKIKLDQFYFCVGAASYITGTYIDINGGQMKKNAVAIVLGRKGSKGVKDKNVMDILGQPAYYYSISASQNSKYISQTFASLIIPR